MCPEQPHDLDIFSDTTLKVHIGAEEVEVFPPTTAQLRLASKRWAEAVKKTKTTGENIKVNDKAKDMDAAEAGIDVAFSVGDHILPIIKVYLAPRGQVESDISTEDIQKQISLYDQRRILAFVRRTSGLGEFINEAMIQGMAHLMMIPVTPQKQAGPA